MPTSFCIFAGIFSVGFLGVGLLGQCVDVYAVQPDVAQIPLLGDSSGFLPAAGMRGCVFPEHIGEHVLQYLEFSPYI